jgi:hypothetical protein
VSLTVQQTLTAVAPNITSSFGGVGGTSPYAYSVLAGGAGGSIDPTAGLYTAPPAMNNTSPSTLFDTIQVIDSTPVTPIVATAKIMVATPLFLVADIIQTYMQLAIGRVYLWDQQLFQPTDAGLYVAVSMPSAKPFGNNQTHDTTTGNLIQSVNMLAQVDIDIISRGPAARDQKEQVVLAMLSDYSLQQQYANAFSIGRLPASGRFVNLSQVDGAAIPYRYKITFNLTYAANNAQPSPYFNQFTNPPTVYTNP